MGNGSLSIIIILGFLLFVIFYNQQKFSQIRIEGSVEILDDMELKKQIVEDLPFLKPLIESKGYDVLICYRIKNARAIFWTMEKNFEPKQYIEL